MIVFVVELRQDLLRVLVDYIGVQGKLFDGVGAIGVDDDVIALQELHTFVDGPDAFLSRLDPWVAVTLHV